MEKLEQLKVMEVERRKMNAENKEMWMRRMKLKIGGDGFQNGEEDGGNDGETIRNLEDKRRMGWNMENFGVSCR